MTDQKKLSPITDPRLDCYRIILCNTVLRDQNTGLTSAINMTDGFMLPGQLLGEVIPSNVIADFAGDGVYELAFVWKGEDGSSYRAGDTALAAEVRGRFQFCAPSLRMPSKPGAYMLTVEWHRENEPWQPSSAICPVVIQRSDAPAARDEKKVVLAQA